MSSHLPPLHPALLALAARLQPSILTQINDPLWAHNGVELWLKRDDLLHPIISGNKWRKLKYSLAHAMALGADTLVSMGGAYSNHLHALAYTGQQLGLKTIGYIRGEAPQTLNPSLSDMRRWGMDLRFVSRSDYRMLRRHKSHDDLPDRQAGHYWLPEGGAQPLALAGVGELLDEITVPYDVLCTPCGTGATLAGLIAASPPSVSVWGFAALKNAGFLSADVESLLPKAANNWHINLNYPFGGFAKTTPELMAFMADFNALTGIALDPVYTGKMMYALYDLLKQQRFTAGQRIIAIHTGGLQGNRGFI